MKGLLGIIIGFSCTHFSNEILLSINIDYHLSPYFEMYVGFFAFSCRYHLSLHFCHFNVNKNIPHIICVNMPDIEYLIYTLLCIGLYLSSFDFFPRMDSVI